MCLHIRAIQMYLLRIQVFCCCCVVDEDDSNSSLDKKKKRRSRWGDTEAEKNIVTGLPVVVPQGLTKEQEEQYLRKFSYFVSSFTVLLPTNIGSLYLSLTPKFKT